MNRVINRNAPSDFESVNPEMTLREVEELLGDDYVDIGSDIPLLIYDYEGDYKIYIRICHQFMTMREWKIDSVGLTQNGTVLKRVFSDGSFCS